MMDQNITHIPVRLENIGFVQRELKNGKLVRNKCGRDFLYYALNYYRPDLHNAKLNNPQEIEEGGLFGIKVPSWLVWTLASFIKVPKYFRSLGLQLSINGKIANSFPKFLNTMFSKPKAADESISVIEKSIDNAEAVGVDVAVSLGGLVDHVMFVYGYNKDNFYILDTRQEPRIGYDKLTPVSDKQFFMRLPKSFVREHWTRWSRVWIVRNNLQS